MREKLKAKWLNAVATPKSRYTSGRGTVIMYLASFCIIVAGFVFFLTSSLWIPNGNETEATKLDFPIQLTSQSTLTLKKWVYAPDQHLMEIEIKKDNSYLSTDYSYLVNAYTDKRKQIQVIVSYNCDDFMVLHLVDVPGCKWIDLQVDLTITDSSSETVHTAVLSCTLNSVEQDNSIKLDYTESEYILNSLKNEQKLLDLKIAEVQNQISVSQQKISDYQKRVAELELNKAYQTGQDIASSDRKIEQLKAAIERENQNMEILKQNMSALQMKRQEIEKSIKRLDSTVHQRM